MAWAVAFMRRTASWGEWLPCKGGGGGLQIQILRKKYEKRSSLVVERLTVNALVATVLGSIPTFVGTVESEERQMKQC
jgi:hypothetical protein